jgi:uncharacterized membrane protein YtjA (UPF0391 family)
MLGWVLVFALMTIVAAVLSVAAGPVEGMIAAKVATLIFGVLFLITAVTSLARGRA